MTAAWRADYNRVRPPWCSGRPDAGGVRTAGSWASRSIPCSSGNAATMHFVLFKLPRTGSSSLGMALNTGDSFCRNEILNHWNPAVHGPSQACIDAVLATASTRIRGFTLNPFKAPQVAPDFWSFPEGAAHDRLVVLLRRDPWPATVSRMICRHMGVFPGNSADATAGAVQAKVRGGIRIDPLTFLAAYRKALRNDERLQEFARDYAERHAAPLCVVRYEKVFGEDATDLHALEAALGCRVDRQYLAPALKILPDDGRAFMINFAELEHAVNEARP